MVAVAIMPAVMASCEKDEPTNVNPPSNTDPELMALVAHLQLIPLKVMIFLSELYLIQRIGLSLKNIPVGEIYHLILF